MTKPIKKTTSIFFFAFFISVAIHFPSYGQLCPKSAGTEAVVNGDFENGNDGTSTFGTHKNFEGAGLPYSGQEYYYIGYSSLTFNYGFPKAVYPHHGTKMLMLDAANLVDAVCWEQTITVLSGQTYYFSAWLTSLSAGERCQLQFQIKGNNDPAWTPLGPSQTAPAVGVWEQVYETWNAGTNTSATIRLSDYNPLHFGAGGNDFAVDEISFINSCANVVAGPKANFGSDSLSLCSGGGMISLNSNLQDVAPTKFTWFKENVQLSNTTNILSNITQTGIYTVCVDSLTCVNQTQVKVVANYFVDLGPDLNLCSPPTTILSTGISSPANFQITWKKNGVDIPGETGTTLRVTQAGKYKVVVVDKVAGLCNGTDSIIITSSMPIPQDATFCPPATTATLSISGSGKYKWWDAATGGNAVGKGSSFLATGLSDTKTFYVQDTTEIQFKAGLLNDNTWAGSDKTVNNFPTQNFISFTAKENSTLDTIAVKVYFVQNTGSYNFRINFVDKTTGTDYTKDSKMMPAQPLGERYIDVTLGYSLIAGHQYQISIFPLVGINPGTGTLRYNGGGFITYPNNSPLITLDGSQAPTVYPGLFNWRLHTLPLCDRMPVRAIKKCAVVCTPPATPALSPAGPFNFCTGTSISKTLTATVSNSGSASFQYEFFRNGISVQAASSLNTYTATQNGNYYVVITDPVDPTTCKAQTNTVLLNTVTNPTASAGSDIEICAGTSTELTASGGDTYSWSNSVLTAQNTVKPTETTMYTVTVTNSSTSCTDKSDVIVSVIPDIKANAGSDQNLCAVDVTLAGNDPTPGTGAWSIVTGGTGTFSDAASNTSTFTPDASGTYKLRWTITNPPCATNSSDVTIDFKKPPTIADAGPAQTVCGKNATLAGNLPSPGTGAWSIVSGGTGTFSNASDNASSFTADAYGIYTLRWTISNPPCTATTSDVTVEFKQTPTAANAGSDQIVCGTNYTLAGNAATSGAGAWSIVSGGTGTFTDVASNTSTFTPDALGTYKLRWTISNPPCTATAADVNIEFKQSTVTADAGQNQTLCGKNVTLAGNLPSPGTGAWSIVSGGTGTFTDAANNASSFVADAFGTYILKWTITVSPCSPTSSNVTVEFKDVPTTAAAGSDQIVCGTNFTLAGNTPTSGTGAWTIVSGGTGTFSDEASNTSSFTPDALGSYKLRWTISNPPCTATTSDVNIEFKQSIINADAGQDQTVCGKNVTLSGNSPSPGTGAWSIVSGGTGTFSNAASNASSFVADAFGTYILKWTITVSPCSPTSSDVTVEFKDVPTTADAGNDQVNAAMCGQTSTTLSANSPAVGTGAWSIVNGTGGTLGDPNFSTSAFNGVQDMLYTLRWTTSNSPCPASADEVNIKFHSIPNATVPDQDICLGQSQLLQAVQGQGKYRWSTNDTLPTIKVNPTIQTTYSLTITNSDQCTASGQTVVTVNPIPSADFIADPAETTTGVQISFTILNAVNVNSTIWRFGDGLYNAGQMTTQHIYTDTGLYSVSLIISSAKNCLDTITKKNYVIIHKRQFIWIPSAFTPNGDGNNDLLSVMGEIKSMHLDVYNQWGLLIFSSESQTVSWDGKYKGVEQPEGNYVFIFNGINTSNETVKEQGLITLIR